MIAATMNDKSHVVSNLYFSIMRDCVHTWKYSHKSIKSIHNSSICAGFSDEKRKKPIGSKISKAVEDVYNVLFSFEYDTDEPPMEKGKKTVEIEEDEWIDAESLGVESKLEQNPNQNTSNPSLFRTFTSARKERSVNRPSSSLRLSERPRICHPGVGETLVPVDCSAGPRDPCPLHCGSFEVGHETELGQGAREKTSTPLPVFPERRGEVVAAFQTGHEVEGTRNDPASLWNAQARTQPWQHSMPVPSPESLISVMRPYVLIPPSTPKGARQSQEPAQYISNVAQSDSGKACESFKDSCRDTCPIPETTHNEKSDRTSAGQLGINTCNSSIGPGSSDSDNESVPVTETVLTPLEKSTGDKHCLTESDHMDETRPSNTTDRQTCYRRTEADAVGPSTKITRDRSYSYGQAVFNTRNSSSLHGGAEEAIGHHRLSLQFGAPQLPVGSRRRKVSTVTELKRTIHTMSKAKPQTLKKMYENFQSYAHVVQLEVDEPFGTERCCCCCHGQLCQTYAVMFSQLQEYAYRIVHRFAVHCITTRSDPQRAELLPMTMAGLIIHHGVIRYVVHRARMMKRLGRPQNEEAINRLLQKVTEIEKQLPEVQSSDPMDSRPSTSISSNASSSNPRQRQEYTAFKFGRRRSDHGLVEEWTHAPCPFAETLFPPCLLYTSDAADDC